VLTALIIGEIALLAALLFLFARVRALREDLERLEERFIDHRLAAEEESEALKAGMADLRRLAPRAGPAGFTAETPLARALEMHPGAAGVLASFGIAAGGAEPWGTIGEAARARGADLASLLGRLNRLGERPRGPSLPVIP